MPEPPPALTRLFYVRFNGSTWSTPVNLTDTVAVAWNRFDAVVDTGGHTYIAFMKNDSLGMPALRVMRDSQPPETASLALSTGDTLYYFRLLQQITQQYPVNDKWNMVGSIGVPVPAASVGSIPGGLVSSNFFGFDNGYTTAATIEPGKGYWVKIAEAGKLVLSGAGSVPGASRLRMELEDANPPDPPGDLAAAGESAAGFSLGRNYPNPFNPSTLTGYEVPKTSHVSLIVFDLLGREVATLVDEVKQPGAYSVSWDASGMTAGVYIFRMTAGSFTEARKLLLVR